MDAIPNVTHWKSRDGTLHLPGEMSTQHLIASLDLVARVVRTFLIRQTLAISISPDYHPRGVMNLIEAAYNDHECRAIALKALPVTALMEAEVMRRTRGRPRVYEPEHLVRPFGYGRHQGS